MRRSWTMARRATSSGLFRCGTSGWRRIAPVAVHGASSRTPAALTRGCQTAASAVIASTEKSRRWRLVIRRSRRRCERSTAVTMAPALASCAVLPPGAAHSAGRQDPCLEQVGPALGIAAHREIERRLLEMRAGNQMADLLAIAARPRTPEPVGRVEARRVLRLGEAGTLGAQAPQHGVEQALVRKEATHLGEIDRGRHRGMRRRAQEEQLS